METASSAPDIATIITAYDTYTFREQRRPRTVGRYYPSEAYHCLRRQAYTYAAGVDPTPDPYVLSALSGGVMHHSRVAEALRWWAESHGYTFAEEVPVLYVERDASGLEVTVSGRLDDVIIMRGSGGDTVVVEVKTVANMKRAVLPKKAHIAQLNFYLKAYPNALGVLLVVDRGTGAIRQYTYRFNPQLFNESLARIRRLHMSLTTSTLPEAEAKTNPEMQWMCRACAFSELCSNNRPLSDAAAEGTRFKDEPRTQGF